MKVLYWTEAFWPTIGGIEVFSAQLISALKKQGYEFIVVTDHRNFNIADEMEYNGIPVYRFHFQRLLEKRDISRIAATLQKIAKLKQAFEPDLVHINACGPSLFYHLSTAVARPVYTLVTIHALLSRSGGRDTILGKMLRAADWVSAVSEAMLNDVRQVLPEIAQRSSVIYNSLAMPVVQPEPLPLAAPRLLCLGRVVVEKGFDLAVKAFASLAHRFPKARLVIAGDGPAMSDLRKYTAGLGLTDSVEFTGWVGPEKIPELMNTATMVVMPSRWPEPFGLVALQAAQMARPVVASRVGGLPEVIQHGKTGLLFEKEDTAALSEAIAFLLEQPELAAQMGQTARSRAQIVFDWERFVDAYNALYRQGIKEGSHRFASPCKMQEIRDRRVSELQN